MCKYVCLRLSRDFDWINRCEVERNAQYVQLRRSSGWPPNHWHFYKSLNSLTTLRSKVVASGSGTGSTGTRRRLNPCKCKGPDNSSLRFETLLIVVCSTSLDRLKGYEGLPLLNRLFQTLTECASKKRMPAQPQDYWCHLENLPTCNYTWPAYGARSSVQFCQLWGWSRTTGERSSDTQRQIECSCSCKRCSVPPWRPKVERPTDRSNQCMNEWMHAWMCEQGLSQSALSVDTSCWSSATLNSFGFQSHFVRIGGH